MLSTAVVWFCVALTWDPLSTFAFIAMVKSLIYPAIFLIWRAFILWVVEPINMYVTNMNGKVGAVLLALHGALMAFKYVTDSPEWIKSKWDRIYKKINPWHNEAKEASQLSSQRK